jgi:dihydrofolate reductase
VFVLTHHAREPLELTGTTFTFVTDGFDAALELARAAAGGRDVHVAGGGQAVQEALRAGAVDEIQLHVAPVLLGGGAPLFGELDEPVELERTRVIETPAATHVRYRVRR